MADVTIYKPANVTVQTIDGDPPVDQSAEVAALTAQVNALTARIAAKDAEMQVAAAAIAAGLAA